MPRLAPPRDRHFWLASRHYQRNQFQKAAEELTRQLESDPGNSSLHQQRSRARLFQGDWAGAENDLARAFRLSPSDPWFLEQWLQILLHRGGDARIESLLSQGILPPATREFWRGCLSCRRKRYDDACRRFARAAALGLEPAGIFRCAALALGQAGSKGQAAGPRLALVGLGYRKITQTSVGGVQALARSDVLLVVCSAVDDLLLRFLGLFALPVEFIVFRGTEREARRGAKALVKACSGRRAALVTRGHPLVFGLLAGLILDEARRRRVACQVWDGVSGFDEMPALAEPATGGGGMQVAGCFNVQDCDPGLPLAAYVPRERRGLDALEAALSRRLPADRPCYYSPNSGPDEFKALPVRIGKMRRVLEEVLPCTVYVP